MQIEQDTFRFGLVRVKFAKCRAERAEGDVSALAAVSTETSAGDDERAREVASSGAPARRGLLRIAERKVWHAMRAAGVGGPQTHSGNFAHAPEER